MVDIVHSRTYIRVEGEKKSCERVGGDSSRIGLPDDGKRSSLKSRDSSTKMANGLLEEVEVDSAPFDQGTRADEEFQLVLEE